MTIMSEIVVFGERRVLCKNATSNPAEGGGDFLFSPHTCGVLHHVKSTYITQPLQPKSTPSDDYEHVIKVTTFKNVRLKKKKSFKPLRTDKAFCSLSSSFAGFFPIKSIR